MSKAKEKEEKKEVIEKPLSIELREVLEEITNAINRHHLTAVSIEDIGFKIVDEGRRLQQQEEQLYFEKLQESMRGDKKENDK